MPIVQILKYIKDRLRRLNAYAAIFLMYATWMLFFDDQNVFFQYRLYSKLKALERDLYYYDIKIREVERAKKALLNDSSLLEKYAREKYYMKKDKEDLYVIVDE